MLALSRLQTQVQRFRNDFPHFSQLKMSVGFKLCPLPPRTGSCSTHVKPILSPTVAKERWERDKKNKEERKNIEVTNYIGTYVCMLPNFSSTRLTLPLSRCDVTETLRIEIQGTTGCSKIAEITCTYQGRCASISIVMKSRRLSRYGQNIAGADKK